MSLAKASKNWTRSALGIEMARNPALGSHPKQPLIPWDDLCELDRVDELPEARQLAVADIPDVDSWLPLGWRTWNPDRT
jgi:hypothetical protein